MARYTTSASVEANETISAGAQSVALGKECNRITIQMSPDATVTEFSVAGAATGKAKLWAGDEYTFQVAASTLYYHGAGAPAGSFTILAEGG